MGNQLNNEFLRLASRVNGHILKCDKCLALVDAYQKVYDELDRMGKLSELEKTAERQHYKKEEVESLQL